VAKGGESGSERLPVVKELLIQRFVTCCGRESRLWGSSRPPRACSVAGSKPARYAGGVRAAVGAQVAMKSHVSDPQPPAGKLGLPHPDGMVSDGQLRASSGESVPPSPRQPFRHWTQGSGESRSPRVRGCRRQPRGSPGLSKGSALHLCWGDGRRFSGSVPFPLGHRGSCSTSPWALGVSAAGRAGGREGSGGIPRGFAFRLRRFFCLSSPPASGEVRKPPSRPGLQ